MMAMKRAFAALSRMFFKALYRVCCIRSRRDEVLFLSRQADKPSDNFHAVGRAFQERGWIVTYHVRRLSRKTALAWVVHVVREVGLLARCRVCVLDRYDPVVGLLDFECEPAVPSGRLEGRAAHSEFPVRPIVIQLWHAFGAFKKFGYQSLDTMEGHSRETALTFGIHRNYSWIVCTGEQNRAAFAEAFACPVERVVALGLPEYDELVTRRKAAERCAEPGRTDGEEATGSFAGRHCAPNVLFAPTLRINEASEHPFRELAREWKEDRPWIMTVVWSFHPLETGSGASGGVSDDLLHADYVVTDYSSIVYEAYLLGKRVLFYVPDLESYRASPGLNADPAQLAPEITFTDRFALMRFLELLSSGEVEYPQEGFDRFVGATFDGCSVGTAERIADFALRQVPGDALVDDKPDVANDDMV